MRFCIHHCLLTSHCQKVAIGSWDALLPLWKGSRCREVEIRGNVWTSRHDTINKGHYTALPTEAAQQFIIKEKLPHD